MNVPLVYVSDALRVQRGMLQEGWIQEHKTAGLTCCTPVQLIAAVTGVSRHDITATGRPHHCRSHLLHTCSNNRALLSRESHVSHANPSLWFKWWTIRAKVGSSICRYNTAVSSLDYSTLDLLDSRLLYTHPTQIAPTST